MNKIINIAYTLTILFAGCFTSCEVDQLWDKDHLFEYTEAQDGVFIYDCSSREDWHFFSFEKGEIIGSCNATDEEANEAWRKRTDWDLAFHRQDIKSNSGVSGIGSGGILTYQQDAFNFEAVTEAPEEGYVVDVMDSVVYNIDNMMNEEIIYAHTGVNPETKNWAVLTDMMNGIWTYAQKVFVVRTANGKYAKIYLKNFKSNIGVSGTVTMQYVYQHDGSVNLETEKN